MKLMQININGIRNKCQELVTLLHENQIDVAAIQETKLEPGSADPPTPGYAIFREDRQHKKGGGLAFLVSHRTKFTPVNISRPADDAEFQAVDIYTGNDKIRVINFYLPTEAQASPQQIKSLLDATTIVVGDANAHHPLWDKKGKPDQRGEEMIELLEDGNLVLLNEPNTYTRGSRTIRQIAPHHPTFRPRPKTLRYKRVGSH